MKIAKTITHVKFEEEAKDTLNAAAEIVGMVIEFIDNYEHEHMMDIRTGEIIKYNELISVWNILDTLSSDTEWLSGE